MTLTSIQRSQVISAMEEAHKDANFGDRPLWLTFYLNAPQQQLEALGHMLAVLGAVNLQGAEGGFIYPKLPVSNSASDTADLIDRVLNLCREHAVDPITIDLDTDADVTRSKFRTLLEFEL